MKKKVLLVFVLGVVAIGSIAACAGGGSKESASEPTKTVTVEAAPVAPVETTPAEEAPVTTDDIVKITDDAREATAPSRRSVRRTHASRQRAISTSARSPVPA